MGNKDPHLFSIKARNQLAVIKNNWVFKDVWTGLNRCNQFIDGDGITVHLQFFGFPGTLRDEIIGPIDRQGQQLVDLSDAQRLLFQITKVNFNPVPSQPLNGFPFGRIVCVKV